MEYREWSCGSRFEEKRKDVVKSKNQPVIHGSCLWNKWITLKAYNNRDKMKIKWLFQWIMYTRFSLTCIREFWWIYRGMCKVRLDMIELYVSSAFLLFYLYSSRGNVCDLCLIAPSQYSQESITSYKTHSTNFPTESVSLLFNKYSIIANIYCCLPILLSIQNMNQAIKDCFRHQWISYNRF